MKSKQTVIDVLTELREAAQGVVLDFDTYGEVLQTDGNGDYSKETAIERLRRSYKKAMDYEY